MFLIFIIFKLHSKSNQPTAINCMLIIVVYFKSLVYTLIVLCDCMINIGGMFCNFFGIGKYFRNCDKIKYFTSNDCLISLVLIT